MTLDLVIFKRGKNVISTGYQWGRFTKIRLWQLGSSPEIEMENFLKQWLYCSPNSTCISGTKSPNN